MSRKGCAAIVNYFRYISACRTREVNYKFFVNPCSIPYGKTITEAILSYETYLLLPCFGALRFLSKVTSVLGVRVKSLGKCSISSPLAMLSKAISYLLYSLRNFITRAFRKGGLLEGNIQINGMLHHLNVSIN